MEEWWDNGVTTKNNHYIKFLGMFLKAGKEPLIVINVLLFKLLANIEATVTKPASNLF
jgi:hypothetical protein